MSKCVLALTNILITGATAALEYNTAPTEEEGIRRVGERIKKNKTVETIFDCLVDNDCGCKD